MNEFSQMIIDTSQRIFADLCEKSVIDQAEAGEWPAALWQALEESGLTLAGIDEQFGGTGGQASDALLVIREGARAAAPLPLAENYHAASILAELKQTVPEGPLTLAQGCFDFENGRLTGSAANVPFASQAKHLVLLDESGGVYCVAADAVQITPGTSIAGEARDQVQVDVKTSPSGNIDPESFKLRGAQCRAVMMSGALESTLQLAVQYAQERSQFGRAISKFQAIQHQLATLATEVAAASRAADMLIADQVDPFQIAVAKARIGEAVGVGSEIAHQVHGAIGYTLEHSLNHRTRRLWVWRDEFGNETEWNRQVGEAVLDLGADQLWPFLARQ